MDCDVLVIGSGAGGLTAAITAAKSGLTVTLLEATAVFGGTTAFSGGGVWIPANHHQPELGVDDSAEDAEAYLKAVLGNYYDSARIGAFIAAAPAMLRFLEAETEVLLTASTIPDYTPGEPGWKTGRCLLTADYDGRRLGPWFAKLRRPIPEMGLFASMQLSPLDAYMMANWNKSMAGFTLTARRMLGYAGDRLRGRRGSVLANGNALAGRLLKSAVDAGVTLLEERRGRSLIVEDGTVTGIIADHHGAEERYTARRGVILATGGFGANDTMRREQLPQSASGWSLMAEGSQGDGIAMGTAVGGNLNTENHGNGIWVPASAFTRADGTLAKFPSLFFDRHCPGSILVDARTGKRFVNESGPYQSFGEAAHRAGVTRIWQINDLTAVKKYGMGMVKPAPFPITPWVRKGYVIEARSIAELAGKIGLDPAALGKTVDDFNRYAEAGKDPDFRRGDDYYSAYMGDATHGPNPALGPLRDAPFYALELRPSDLSTLVGLDTNEHAQVVTREGAVIPGLYAAGVDSNNIMRGRYPGGGSSIGPAMTFGYLAARHLAGAGTA